MSGQLLLCVVLAAAPAEGKDLQQAPARKLAEGETFGLDVYGLQRATVYTLSDQQELNTVVLEVHPDGYVRVVRVFGSARFAVPIQGKDLTFTVGTGQRVGIWSIGRLEATLKGGELSFRLVPPKWAVALEVEFGGLTGLLVRYAGKEGLLLTGQRMDSLIDRTGKVLLARSGKGVEVKVPAAGMEEARVRELEQPGAYKPPRGWHGRPRWTALPLLPAVPEPLLPPVVSP